MKLDARLRAAAEAAGRCALFADIGSDHAKLALHLLETGAAAYAVCADIHASPLERGRQAAARTGLSERADFILSDGLDALPERPDVAAVCGMGGELIADIVARALRRFPGGPPIRFVLQPMTAADALRRFLWDNGFYIAEERYAVAAGKPYAVLTALSAPCIEQENAAAFSAPQNAYTFTSSGEREAFSPSSASAELVSALRNSYASASTENAQRSPRVPLQRNSYPPRRNSYTLSATGEREAFSPSSASAELVSAPRNSYASTSTENAKRSPRVPLQRNSYTLSATGEREAFSPSSVSAELVSAPRNSYASTSTENAKRSPRVPLQRNSYTYADLHLGKLRPQTPEYRAYVRRVCAAAEKRLRGRLADGGDPADELLLLREAGEFL